MPSLTFRDIEHLGVLRKFHEMIRTFFGVGFGLFDLEGNQSRELTSMARFNPLCTSVKATPAGRQSCARCDLEACARCIQTKQPSIYDCHLGLTEIMVPICLHGEAVAIFSSGQFLTARPSPAGFARMQPKLKALGVDGRRARSYYFHTPVIQQAVAESVVELIVLVSDYVAESEQKILEIRNITQPDQIRRVEQIMAARFAEDLSLKDIAHSVGLSQSRMAHLMKERLGTTFTEYRNQLRIERSKYLLANSHLKVISIAFETGFGNLSHFHNTFKDIVGCSPLEYRRQHSAGQPGIGRMR